MPVVRRILIVDDHSTFRLGLSALLSSVPGLEVAGEAATGAEAVAAAATLEPDVVVMDLSLPDLGGVEATERIVRARPGVGVLVLTMFDDDEHVLAALRAGARGYILKTTGPDGIVRAVQAVGNGEVIFGQPVASHVPTIFADVPAHSDESMSRLTGREREVLALMVRGASNAAIADILVVSPKTVRNHITSIFRKLDVTDRKQAVKRARAAGLG
ncbi:response regulator transcription factor [Actinophytocola sp.]|uniref:response regulator transcription factor n=1 Tax=Actinophytocola sp. TaxID=1872138 RepID=UPI002DDD6B64|nr:response regulator transcription factor [Actinophytocola sp.]